MFTSDLMTGDSFKWGKFDTVLFQNDILRLQGL